MELQNANANANVVRTGRGWGGGGIRAVFGVTVTWSTVFGGLWVQVLATKGPYIRAKGVAALFPSGEGDKGKISGGPGVVPNWDYYFSRGETRLGEEVFQFKEGGVGGEVAYIKFKRVGDFPFVII